MLPKNKDTTFWLPRSIRPKVSELQKMRGDVHLSTTVTYCINKTLSDLGFLSEEESELYGFDGTDFDRLHRDLSPFIKSLSVLWTMKEGLQFRTLYTGSSFEDLPSELQLAFYVWTRKKGKV